MLQEIQKAICQTPMEIALGIDESGMTTAKKLYEFLEMSPASYARWFKRNILENQFAEEDIDYFRFSRPVESAVNNGQVTQDARLTASFAKKLSMQQKSERGEQARNYFVSVEDKAKDMVLMLREASGNPMKLLELHYAAIKQVDSKADQALSSVEELKQQFNTFEKSLPLLPNEADEVSNAVKKRVVEILGGKESAAYKNRGICQRTFMDAYRELKRNFNAGRYKDIKREQKTQALEVAGKYEPPLFLKEQIDQENAQMQMEFRERQNGTSD